MTDHPRRVTRALLSVSDKTGLIEFARALAEHGVELVSTGGTAKAIATAGLKVSDVSDLTGFPEMMDGRVKTLHPKVHGGLLAIRDNKEHAEAMRAHGIAPIDLLVVNLYPFEATVDNGAAFEDCIENIDIGGPAMIRAAAKNHNDVAVVVEPQDYFDPLPWWGGIDAGRMLVHRGVDPLPDHGSTVGFRKSAIRGLRSVEGTLPASDPVRRLASQGAEVFSAIGLFVRRLPPLFQQWLRQRPLQAGSDFVLPVKTIVFFSLS